jgi:hypothetical protein
MPGADVLPKSKTREMDRVFPDMHGVGLGAV